MTEPRKGEKLAEGKTKIVWQCPGRADDVLIESKNDITAGDGARRHLLPGKGQLATATTCRVFELLDRRGMLTHYLGQLSPTIFRARRMTMIPLELVARRIATGSYLKRHPEVAEGTRFEDPVLEMFLKDDARHDPMVLPAEREEVWELYDPKRPTTAGPIDRRRFDDLRAGNRRIDLELTTVLIGQTEAAFIALEAAWAAQDVTLVDFKIECGFDTDGVLRIGDVVDNDSWRIWPKGQKTLDVSKQVFRDLPVVTDEALKPIRDKYAWVANAVERFSTLP
ncbi:MAG: phosphoribosylaminoimidazole-succinocarboxamide synthase [Parcubacteria group bacterium Gr01-1014_31]|nr:MAG: phosphoribosylaminoimidazole-succinocarboxamide synthase [Parcubacteria group bacterium Gr01-1014_31]